MTDERTYPADAMGKTLVVHAEWAKQLERENAALRADKELMDKFDSFISTQETQRLFLLPTRRDCNSVREALRVATSCHVPEEAK